ncbi:MAG: sulfatase-like hydrolase/transferase [Polyangiaceae bacterium]
MSRSEKDESAKGLPVAAGVFAGFALLAAANACAIAIAVPAPPTGLRLRAFHYLFDAAETLGVGALVALVLFATTTIVGRLRVPRWATWGVIVAITMVVVERAIGDPLHHVASHALNGRFEAVLFAGYLTLFGVGFADLLRLASFLSRRPRLRFLPAAFAVGVLAVSQILVPDDYAGAHSLAALGAALVAGAGLAPLAERAGRALMRSRSGQAALAALALFAFFGVAWPPSNATRVELFRQPSALAPWILATTLWRPPGLHAPVAVPPSPWNADRSSAPPVPPTSPPLLPKDAVVVLLTIDALRASAVGDPANDALFPTLARLKREGVVFTHASSAGAQTASSLSTLFTGLYYSERRWADHGVGDTRYLFPADDPAPHFPEILSDHGVMTASHAGLFFLGGDFGVVGRFRDAKVLVEGRKHADAGELVEPILERLRRPVEGPLFLYAHLLDPHAPYDRGRKDGTDYERYLSEVAIADAAVGLVERVLKTGFGPRWALFVSADHGEAFGEHGTHDHGRTLYEELLHVPLLARSPLFPPRTIDERVGLVDLGPTILDLFGVATPATFNGQSLVPILAGGTRSFTRPLLAEGRLRQSLTEPDGLKVIWDPLRKLVEVYDLAADPGETRNIFDVDPVRSDHALAALHAFFAVHTRRDGGYEPPYMR